MFGWFEKLLREPAPLPPLGFTPDFLDPADAPAGAVVLSIENDDETPMEFVVQVLRDYCGLPDKTAIEMVLRIHTEGGLDVRMMKSPTRRRSSGGSTTWPGREGIRCSVR